MQSARILVHTLAHCVHTPFVHTYVRMLAVLSALLTQLLLLTTALLTGTTRYDY
jgi:hypothetical protein